MAEYSENLQLYKKDPVTDGADTFNIKTMLNDNWDKIDAAVKELDYDPAGNSAAVQKNLTAAVEGINTQQAKRRRGLHQRGKWRNSRYAECGQTGV